jgi:23S rRNA pseudouridine2605 synthase
VKLLSPERRERADTAVLLITIHEGRNRQVRRMCEAVGHPVQRLTRIRFGPLSAAGMKPGAVRELTPPEVRALKRLVARD